MSQDPLLRPNPARHFLSDLRFALRSADTNFVLRLRGLYQIDSRWSDDDAINDGFLVLRGRPIIEGTVFRGFDVRFTPEFAGSTPALRDAWLNHRFNNALEFRVGKMKPPGSLERWQSAANALFIGRNLVSLLWPVRDIGVLLHGEFWPGADAATKSLAATGLINYDLGLFNGAGDARAAGDSDFDGGKTGTGRLFVHPLLTTGLAPLQKFGVGLSGTYSEMSEGAGLPDDLGYVADVTADGVHWRLRPQACWYWGSFGLLGEYAISSQRIKHKSTPVSATRFQNAALAITAS